MLQSERDWACTPAFAPAIYCRSTATVVVLPWTMCPLSSRINSAVGIPVRLLEMTTICSTENRLFPHNPPSSDLAETSSEYCL